MEVEKGEQKQAILHKIYNCKTNRSFCPKFPLFDDVNVQKIYNCRMTNIEKQGYAERKMNMDKKSLYCYTGHPMQMYSIRRVNLDEGRAKGTSVIEVTTAEGLQIDILPDMGLDIGKVCYKGINTSYITKNGYDSPAVFLPVEMEFLNAFSGGLVYTCGLRNVGPSCQDGAAKEYHPQHGRVHGLQAEQVTACTKDNKIIVSGVLRESALFGHVLQLRRRIIIPIWGSSITVEDTLENLTPHPEEFMLLYHCNFGYPLLSESARLVLPDKRKTTPRTEHAKTYIGRECTFDPPEDGAEEQVFFHSMDECWARLENPTANIAVTLKWSGDTLPVLAQWRSMASGDYALGLEPSNNYIMGRSAERDNGSLKTLAGFADMCTKIELEFEEMNR